MRERERAAVVELLRESAALGGIAAAYQLRYGVDVGAAHNEPGGRAAHPIWESAVKAREAASAGQHIDYAEACSIAAQRVEEGEWP